MNVLFDKKFFILCLNRSLFFVLTFFIFSFYGYPRQENKEKKICKKFTSPSSWSYCYYKGRGEKKREFLYVLHGYGGNEYVWDQGFNKNLKFILAQSQRGFPSVVALSFGPDIIVGEKDASGNSFENFTVDYLEKIERAHGAFQEGKRTPRIFLGYSMGALSSLILGLKNENMAHTFILACPALFKLNPFGTKEEWVNEVKKYGERTGAGLPQINVITYLVHKNFHSQKSWSSYNPINFIKNRKKNFKKKKFQVFFLLNQKDEFGFYQDAQYFVQKSFSFFTSSTVLKFNSGHCQFDRPDLIASIILNSYSSRSP